MSSSTSVIAPDNRALFTLDVKHAATGRRAIKAAVTALHKDGVTAVSAIRYDSTTNQLVLPKVDAQVVVNVGSSQPGTRRQELRPADAICWP